MIKYNDYYSDEENKAISRLMEENGIKDFKEIENLYYKGQLDLYGTDVKNIKSLDCIKDWDFVYVVKIVDNQLNASLEPLCKLKNLEKLFVHNFDGKKLEAIKGCTNLKIIQLLRSVTDITFMSEMRQVEVLDLSYNHDLSDISVIEVMLKMKRLNLTLTGVSDIRAVRGLKDLESLDLNLTKVCDLSPLKNLNNLKDLHIYGTPVKDISMLAGLPKLIDIDAQKTNVEDVSSFIKAGKLKVIYIEKSKLPKPEKKDIPKEIGKVKTKIREKEIKLTQIVKEEEIKEFEEKYKIQLPENYKAFITEIGDGWEGIEINGEQVKDCKRFKECRFDEKGVSRKFKYTESWIWEEDDDATEKKINNALKNGSIELMDLGDGMSYHLIVNGKSAGQVWLFTGEGVTPYGNGLSSDFFDWVHDILDGNF